MRNPTIMDYFKNKAEEWDTPIKIERTEKFVTELLKNHTPSRSDKVLDYGCGTGLVGIEMSKITREIIYIDKSEAMLNVLRQKLDSNKNFGSTIIHGDIFSYNQRDIDLITILMALHHVEDIEGTMRHISKNIIKPSGVIVIGDLREEDGSFHDADPVPHNGINTDKLSAILKNVGIKVIKNYTFNTITKQDNTYEQFIMVAQKSI